LKRKNLEFYVEDSGIGIPEDKHDEIFKRFRQLECNLILHKKGSGLGLSISKGYVNMLGGNIWVDSTVGKGSVFHFTIPYKAVSQTKETEVKSENLKSNETLN